MSVIVKHRTDLDLVAERVGVKLGAPSLGLPRPHRPPRRASARSCAREGVAVGTSELLDALRGARRGRLDRPGRLPRGAVGDAGEVARGPADLRAGLRPLLLPRRRGAPRSKGVKRGRRRAGAECGDSDEIDLDDAAPADRAALRDGSEAALRDLARLAIAAFGREARARGSSASTCSASAARSACAPSRSQTPPRRAAPHGAPARRSCAASRRCCGASSSASRSSARRRCRPSLAPERVDRALPSGPCFRTSQPCTVS